MKIIISALRLLTLCSVLLYMSACGVKFNSVDEAEQVDLSSNSAVGVQSELPVIIINLMPISVNKAATLGAGQFCISVKENASSLSFKWFKNNEPAKYDANKRCYLVPVLDLDDIGDYEVEVSNTIGKVRSARARLSVVGPPVITQELVAMTSNLGAILAAGQFCVTATGENLAYSWSKNGQIATYNANRRCYFTSALTEQETGYYTVTITNPAGSVSSMAGLTVGAGVLPPLTGVTITSQLVPIALRVGATLIPGQFCVTAFGNNLSYVWNKDGVLAPYNANKRCYITPALAEADSGSYSVTVSNSGGSATSTASIDVMVAPVISTNLNILSVVAESALIAGQFCVAATGKNLVYSWKKAGIEASNNANKRCYLIPLVNMADAGSYTVTVANFAGSVTSTAGLTVTPSAGTAVITKILQNFSVKTATALIAGQFCVEATGTNLNYSWKKDGVVAPYNANKRCYITSALSEGDSGVYTVTVSNQAATVLSSATLSVITPASITVPLANLSVTAGTLLAAGQFCTTAIGANLTYEWKKGGVLAPYNANKRCYITNFLTAVDSGEYTVTVSNSVSSETSSATLNVAAAVMMVSGVDFFNPTFDQSIVVAGLIKNQISFLRVQSAAIDEVLYVCLEFQAKESVEQSKSCKDIDQFTSIVDLPKFGWIDRSFSGYRAYEFISQGNEPLKCGEYKIHVRSLFNYYIKSSSFVVN